jgi:hypothetical protein
MVIFPEIGFASFVSKLPLQVFNLFLFAFKDATGPKAQVYHLHNPHLEYPWAVAQS